MNPQQWLLAAHMTESRQIYVSVGRVFHFLARGAQPWSTSESEFKNRRVQNSPALQRPGLNRSLLSQYTQQAARAPSHLHTHTLSLSLSVSLALSCEMVHLDQHQLPH